MVGAINQKIKTTLTSLLETYQELNLPQIDELYEEPTALEFLRYVAQNRPFVVRGGCCSWPAVRKWSAEYLLNAIGDGDVNVAITPHGNADSATPLPDGHLAFVKPLERTESFWRALEYITQQELTAEPQAPVMYAQTQNDNLRNEYSELFGDVPEAMSFARIALQKEPDAINFWLGNARSVTAMHKDNYENVYAQIRGRKHFVLLPPVAAACVNEQALPGATYVQEDGGTEGELVVRLDEPAEMVSGVVTWDVDEPEERRTEFSRLTRPLRVTLEEGDMLYLPAMWYHKVSQSCGREGFCLAINYWYDMDFGGQFWTTNAFIRDVGNAILQDEPAFESGKRG